MRALYSFGIVLYGCGVWIAARFNSKAKQWLHGRNGWKANLEKLFGHQPKDVYWFHASSLGEFEQARPVIELLKNLRPEIKILLTFFSPSGYLVRKNYEYANWILYLPLDTKSNARYFLKIVKPKLAVFVKYDFWYNYLIECKNQQIPVIYFSVLLRKNHYLNYPFSGWFIKVLKGVHTFFVQDDFTLNWFNKRGFNRVILSGDTRYDRVLQIVENRKSLPEIEQLIQNNRVLVAGSTWPADEKLISETFSNDDFRDFILIVAPHEISKNRLREVENTFSSFKPVFYSQIANVGRARCLIIDNVGMLSTLYFYADFCYVGGGFGKTVHNTQEPAAYGKPVFFGPHFKNFREAIELVKTGGGFSVLNKHEFSKKLNELLQNPSLYTKSSQAAASVVKKGSGKTREIVDYLIKLDN